MTITTERRVDILTVTPAIAREWMLHNTHNRNLSAPIVNKYSRDMAAGNWNDNGETVKFSKSQALIDGQHRLAAVAHSESAVTMTVSFGHDDQAQETVDGGRVRTFASVLMLRGETSPNEIAALCRRIRLFSTYGIKSAVTNRPADRRDSQPSASELSATLAAHPEIRDYVGPSKKVARAISIPASTIGFLMWLFDHVDADDSEFFFRRLEAGDGLNVGDPIFTLRQKFLHNKYSTTSADSAKVGAFIIKTWNKYREGESATLIKFAAGGANPESFPEPK